MKYLGILTSFLLLLITQSFVYGQSDATSSVGLAKTYDQLTIINDPSLLDYKLSPEGSINPGDSYNLTFIAEKEKGEVCKSCGVKVFFKEEDQEPGDMIAPNTGITDQKGSFGTTITAFSTRDRTLTVEVRTSEETLNRTNIVLPYQGNEIVATFKLINFVVSRVGFLPPMGNIYPIIKEQKYLGDDIREVSLEWNQPFGARIYDVSYYPKDGRYEERETISFRTNMGQIQVPSTENLNILVSACTTENDLSCVGPVSLDLPSLEASQTATGEAIPVKNYGLGDVNYEDYLKWQKEDEGHLEGGMFGLFRSWLEGLYKSF